jgi:hypothetical protein
MKKTTLLLIILTAVCANAEWKFDNDTDVQEKEDKRDEEREEARKALERVRFGVKGGGVVGDAGGAIYGGNGGIMLNFPLSRLSNGNLVLATELNFGGRSIQRIAGEEFYINVPLMFQYVSFFYPTSDIQVHWVPSPKRHVFMHLKTIAEAGAFIDFPFGTYTTINNNGEEKYKDRNFLDPGVMVGYAVQLESIILGARVAASYTDIGSSSLLLQFKGYLGYLF